MKRDTNVETIPAREPTPEERRRRVWPRWKNHGAFVRNCSRNTEGASFRLQVSY